MTDDELIKKIEELNAEYEGQIDEFYYAVGLVMVGRLMGWRVMRLVSPRAHWKLANQLFGDLKILLPERGQYAERSLGLKIADKVGDYWGMIRGSKEAIPIDERRKMV